MVAPTPGFSLFQKRLSASPKDFRDSDNPYKSNEIRRVEYAKDARLKFYQILQSQTHPNFTRTQSTAENTLQSTQNHIGNIEYISSAPTAIVPQPQHHFTDLSEQLHQSPNVEISNISTHISPIKQHYSTVDNIVNHPDDQRSIGKLFMLVESQSRQLDLLKQQMHTLSKHNGCQSNVNKSSQSLDNSMRPTNAMKSHGKHHGVEKKLTPTVNKVSIGVMTSFEFTIRSNLDMKVVPVENPQFLEEICRDDRSHVETVNLLKSPLEKIIENSERSFRQMTDSREEQRHSIKKVDYKCDESLKASTKIGWTFYNNILHHVDEILHDSNRIHSSSVPYDPIYNPNKQQSDLVGRAFSNESNIATANINDGIFASDSLLHPRVHYPTSIMQNSFSTTETNESNHMRKLALKYLSEKLYQSHNVLKIHELSDQLNAVATSDVLENIAYISTKNDTNYESCRTAIKSKFENPNILDIPILKSQPKLL